MIQGLFAGRGKRLFFRMSRLAFGPTQPPIRWVLWVLSPETKRWGKGVDQPLPFSAKVKNDRNYTFTPLYAFMAGTGTTDPVKHNNFTQNRGLCIRQYQYTKTETKPLWHHHDSSLKTRIPTYDVSVNDMLSVYSHWHCKARLNVGFEVLQEIIVKNDIFWGVTPYGLEENCRRFGGTCCLYLQDRRELCTPKHE